VAQVAGHASPTVVAPANGASWFEVQFFAGATDVGDVEIPSQTIETTTPRIAQPIGPDLRAKLRRANERVARGNAIGQRRLRVIDIDAQNLGTQRLTILTTVELILDPRGSN